MSRQPTVLCVDDESHILHVVSLKLRNAGFNVLTAADGDEGLTLALEHVPNLVITDFQMPFRNGLELSVELKQTASTSHIPVLMLTARGFSLDAEQLARTNIVAVLNKPFSPREVLARVQELAAQPAAAKEAS